ncbi:MAG TPA: hypothetical protein VIJ28_09385 [Chloroflexota bacterium]
METLELTWSQQKLQEGIAEGELRARRDMLLDLNPWFPLGG